MKIVLNGKEHETAAQDVVAMVEELGFPKGTVLVELNGTALRREEWGKAMEEGDRVELLRIVAGG